MPNKADNATKINIAIRQGRLDDAPHLKRIARQAYRQYVPRMPKPPAPMLADYAKLLAGADADTDADTIVLVAETTGETTPSVGGGRRGVVGFAIILKKSDGYWLENVAVGDGWRGQGIGGRLLGAVEEALAGKAESYQIYTNAVMTENIGWYRRLGFEDLGQRDDEGYSRVFFRKRL